MLLNASNLRDLNTGYSAAYADGFASAQTYLDQIATRVPSSGAKQSYPWLGMLPGFREWVDERYFHKLEQHDYSITNKSWEDSVEVDRDAIKDDLFGVYTPLMRNLGFEAARFPDQLTFGLLAAGWTTPCYDGQNFFDTDHPGYDSTGTLTSVSNSGGGAGTPWFLLDTRRPLKPLVFQEREAAKFGLLEGEDVLAPVPRRKALAYGANMRCNVGFGLWQQAYGSKATLDATSFEAALAAMMGLCKRSGQPIGIKPNLLVCGPSNRAKALTVVKAEMVNNTTNINRDAVDVLVVEWLP